MAQLPLDLAFPPRYGAEDFLVDPSNADAHATLMRWPDWPDRVALLVGPEGSGKTHLAAIWAGRAAASRFAGAALGDAAPSEIAESHAWIDDADRIGAAETILFHLLNLVRESGSFLLLTAEQPPDRWNLRLPDLLSRLRLAPLLRLDPPSDALIRAVLVKLLMDRQLVVDQSVIDYAALRMDRSLGTARRLVEALDQASLAAGRRITRNVVADVMANLLDSPET